MEPNGLAFKDVLFCSFVRGGKDSILLSCGESRSQKMNTLR